MKQKDIMTFVVVGIVSLMLGIILSGVLINPSSKRQQEVEVVTPFNDQFNYPDKRYFNEESINPVQLIQIREESNEQPFGLN